MTLEQYAAIAEIIGVVLVIASLIYVAQQLRQNTDMMRASAASERVQRDTELSASVSDSQEFAELWVQGRANFEGLGEVERTRLIFFERRAILHWHDMYVLRKKHLLPDEYWRELLWIIRNLGGRRQAIQASWKMFKDSFDESFQDFLDEQFLAAGEPH